MAQLDEAIAIGIGPQTGGKGSINTDVEGATNLIPGVASGSGATGIFLRNPEDLAKAFERIESDGGVVPGSRTRQTGGFTRIDTTFSFDIDMKGNGDQSNDTIDDYDVPEYLTQIFQGARLFKGTATTSTTPYEFGVPSAAQSHKTLKVWRGNVSGGADEAFVFQDCTFNLSWSFEAGVKSVLSVEVLVGSVAQQTNSTFPTNTGATAYGNQIEAAPIVSLAGASIDGGAIRSFRTASLDIAYPVVDARDSNIDTGISKELGTPRDVNFSAEWYVDDQKDDLPDLLESDTPVPVFFTLGTAVANPFFINGFLFDMPLFRGVTTDKVDPESSKAMRAITGYASHTNVDEELTITAV